MNIFVKFAFWGYKRVIWVVDVPGALDELVFVGVAEGWGDVGRPLGELVEYEF